MKDCKDCQVYHDREIGYLRKIEELQKENDRHYSALLGLKNILEALIG